MLYLPTQKWNNTDSRILGFWFLYQKSQPGKGVGAKATEPHHGCGKVGRQVDGTAPGPVQVKPCLKYSYLAAFFCHDMKVKKTLQHFGIATCQPIPCSDYGQGRNNSIVTEGGKEYEGKGHAFWIYSKEIL